MTVNAPLIHDEIRVHESQQVGLSMPARDVVRVTVPDEWQLDKRRGSQSYLSFCLERAADAATRSASDVLP